MSRGLVALVGSVPLGVPLVLTLVACTEPPCDTTFTSPLEAADVTAAEDVQFTWSNAAFGALHCLLRTRDQTVELNAVDFVLRIDNVDPEGVSEDFETDNDGVEVLDATDWRHGSYEAGLFGTAPDAEIYEMGSVGFVLGRTTCALSSPAQGSVLLAGSAVSVPVNDAAACLLDREYAFAELLSEEGTSEGDAWLLDQDLSDGTVDFVVPDESEIAGVTDAAVHSIRIYPDIPGELDEDVAEEVYSPTFDIEAMGCGLAVAANTAFLVGTDIVVRIENPTRCTPQTATLLLVDAVTGTELDHDGLGDATVDFTVPDVSDGTYVISLVTTEGAIESAEFEVVHEFAPSLPCEIHVNAPPADEQVTAGTAVDVAWYSDCATQPLDVDLLLDDVFVQTLATQITNDGAAPVPIPGDVVPDDGYRVCVRTPDHAAQDCSYVFEVVAAGCAVSSTLMWTEGINEPLALVPVYHDNGAPDGLGLSAPIPGSSPARQITGDIYEVGLAAPQPLHMAGAPVLMTAGDTIWYVTGGSPTGFSSAVTGTVTEYVAGDHLTISGLDATISGAAAGHVTGSFTICLP